MVEQDASVPILEYMKISAEKRKLPEGCLGNPDFLIDVGNYIKTLFCMETARLRCGQVEPTNGTPKKRYHL